MTRTAEAVVPAYQSVIHISRSRVVEGHLVRLGIQRNDGPTDIPVWDVPEWIWHLTREQAEDMIRELTAIVEENQ